MRDARGKRCACALLVFHTKHEVSGTKRFEVLTMASCRIRRTSYAALDPNFPQSTRSIRLQSSVGDASALHFNTCKVLKLRSDQTDSVSVDLHQQRLNGDGRLLFCCSVVLRPCLRPPAQPKNQKPPFENPETPAAVGRGCVKTRNVP